MTNTPYYPITLNLANRKCVVIGGGAVAERKVETLLEFHAAVTVVAPELTPRLRDLAAGGAIRHEAEVYAPDALRGAFLVIAATDDREVNKAVSLESQLHGILVNVADDPELCTFFMPAVARWGSFVIAVSTSGKSPALAGWVRARLESCFGPEYGELADLLGELREEVKAKYPSREDRNRAFERILSSDVLDLLAEGKQDEAIERARKCI